MDKLDPRLLSVAITLDEGVVTFDQGLAINVSGSKNITSTQNSCDLTIANLSDATRRQLLSSCNVALKSQYKPREVVISAGRESSGLFQIFRGQIISCNQGQAPDLTLTMKVQTSAKDKGKLIAHAAIAQTSLKELATWIAQALELQLTFDAQDKTIKNFSHSGDKYGLVTQLSTMGGVDCWVDDDTLVVVSRGKSLEGFKVEVDESSGMIGAPVFTEFGVQVKILLNPLAKLGGAISLKSRIIEGEYIICKSDYELSSRDQPFYQVLWAYPSG